jgi:hypothetical protein
MPIDKSTIFEDTEETEFTNLPETMWSPKVSVSYDTANAVSAFSFDKSFIADTIDKTFTAFTRN